VKRALMVLSLLCAQAHAEEAGFPAIRVGDSWEYSGYHDDDGLRSRPLHFKVEIEGESESGGLIPAHRDPRLPDDQQIGEVLDALPAGSCVADILVGLEVLNVEQCAAPPRVGSRWSRELPFKGGRTIRFDIRYAGRRMIAVPAGRFRAHRFDVEQHVISLATRSRVRRVYWYAPEVRGMLVMESQPIYSRGKQGTKVHVELQAFAPTP
jgi:hypothetical protein